MTDDHRFDDESTALQESGFTECCNEYIAFTEGYPDTCSNCGRRVIRDDVDHGAIARADRAFRKELEEIADPKVRNECLRAF